MNSFKKFTIDEKEMTPAQEKRREEIVLSLKKKKDEFKERYGSRWEDVMYATATKMAMKGESAENSLDEVQKESTEMEENYDNMMKWYETSNEKKVYAILKKNNINLPAEGFTLVQNMLKKHRDNVKKAADEIMNKHYPHQKESVELDEAWTADSVVKNAEIGSKKGYGINIKKTGGVTKTPYKHMLMTMRRDKSVRVTFDFGKDEFEGTPESVALYVNKILGIKESVELDEARDDMPTMTFEFPNRRKAQQFAKDIANSAIATGDVIGNKVEVTPFDLERKTTKAIDKYMKKNGGEFIDEDAPANSAGSGAVSGFTPDTVGVSKKKQKKHKKKVRKQLGDILMSNEETKTYRTFMEGLEKNIRKWNTGNDRIMVREKDGHPVFIVSVDEFAKCKSKRKKFERWSRFFDPKSTNGRKIREYSHKNPSKPIVLQCSQSGEMIYLRRRLNDSRLRHNNKKKEVGDV